MYAVIFHVWHYVGKGGFSVFVVVDVVVICCFVVVFGLYLVFGSMVYIFYLCAIFICVLDYGR